MSSPSRSVDASLARHGALTYLEIPASDIAASAAFYQAVLGWKTRPGESPTAAAAKFAHPDGTMIGRLITGRPVPADPGLRSFFYVSDIQEAVACVQQSGGAVVKAPYPEGNLHVAIVRDPAGNLLGLWQSATP